MAETSCLVDPLLPIPSPQLYAYSLPYMNSRTLGDSGDPASRKDTDEDLEDPLGRPIPPDAWVDIPSQCLDRMLDFESIRKEADYTRENYEDAPLPLGEKSVDRLTLRDLVDLALINSREYQTQKETLYQVSLQLSLERFDYQNKFSSNGNGTAGNASHNRNGGTTVNRLSVPTGVAMERMLVTGGDLIASFANNVLLTFNGPSGFATDVSSNILIEFAQPLLQVDVRFESLTQAERNLVYAARDFARFRKQFFLDFASQYYDLIRSFRQIEIDTQNYFSLVRAFNQAEAEYQAGIVPRVQVDQVEQSLLNGRGRLIGTCNGLEQALDRLKISLGIPTETPINIDLTELNELTRLDQLSVSADSTNRVLSRLRTALTNPDRAELASTAAVLLDRVIEATELSQQAGLANGELEELRRTRARFLVDYSRLKSQQILADLQREIQSESPSIPVIFQRSLLYSEAMLNLIEQQFELARLSATISESSESTIQQLELTRQGLADSAEALRNELQEIIEDERLDRLPALVDSSNVLREALSKLVDDVDRFNEVEIEVDPQADLARLVEEIQALMARTSATLNSSGFGLKPIEIETDDAMITALVLRFDLMNQRGQLADDWRQIKLAADELKSVINLNASQSINTRPGVNKPFDFTFDESTTSLRLSVDAPLNRRSQRNSFRRSLIGYQRSLRNLSQLEDTIKFSVRNDLRSLALDREQYLIAVASAALAYERVVSTSLEFRLGTGGVSARDFLEAQTAYTDALSSVASQHIDYIVDRAQLFLDLELLIVDESGFWEELKMEEFQPEPFFEIPVWGQSVYGDLPAVRYSPEIQRMLSIPSAVPEMLPFEEFSPADDSMPLDPATNRP